MAKAVVVDEDGSVVRGEYDGYGRVYGKMGELDLRDGDGHFALYQKCYQLLGGPKYAGPSENAYDQGCGDMEQEPETAADLEALKTKAVEDQRLDRERAEAIYQSFKSEES